MPYISDQSYLAIKPEATDGTAVIPTIVVPLVSENIVSNVNHSADRRMKGINWESDDLLRGARQHEGEVVVLADATVLAHFLNMVWTKGATTGGATGYTHPFTVGDPKSYTIEIRKGLYVVRYFGVKIDTLKLGFSDGKMQLTASIKAKGQVSTFKLGVALSGSVTALTFADDYDEEPTRGLVAGDKVQIGTDELTILTITATGITFAATPLTYSVGEPVYLKPQTVALPTLPEPFMFGQALVGVGADETAATTAAGTRATATVVYDLEIELLNSLFAANGSSRHDPAQIYPQTRGATITLKQLLENEDQRAAWLNRSKQAITLIVTGRTIDAGAGTKNKLTLKFHKVKLLENGDPLVSGELINYEQTFKALYDASDAKAITCEVINPVAGTVF